MSDDVPLFTVDKEAMVLDLYRQGKRRREIASIVRMNFSDIKTIIDREFGPKEEKKKDKNTEQNVYSEALKLFLCGKRQVDVAIKLKIPYEQVRAIYLQYLNLNRMQKLKRIYDKLGENINKFLLLYDKMQENNSSLQQVEDAVSFAGSLPQLQEMHSTLSNDVHAWESKRQELMSSNKELQNQIGIADSRLQIYNRDTEMKKNELLQLSQEADAKKKFIQNFDNDEGYMRIKEAAKNQTEYVMQNNRQLLGYAVTATFEAIRRYPAVQDLFFQLLTVGSNPSYQQTWMESHKNRLVELGEYIQLEMKQLITKEVISDIQNTCSEPGKASIEYAH
jgi:hypothetical protein